MWQLQYWSLWVLGIAFVLTLLTRPFRLYVVVPIKTHRKYVHQLDRKHEVANLEKMSPEARQQLEMLMAQFREEGFEPVEPSLAGSSNDSQTFVNTLLVNSAGDIGAI